jgi:hypothetical protein
MSPTVEYAGSPDTALAVGFTTYTRDGARVEEPLDRSGLRPVLPTRHHADRGVGRLDRELEGDHAVLVAADQAVARVAEGLDHPVVVRQHLRHEALDATLAPGLREVLEQDLADATSLLGVLHEEGDLGAFGRRALERRAFGRRAFGRGAFGRGAFGRGCAGRGGARPDRDALVAPQRDHPL